MKGKLIFEGNTASTMADLFTRDLSGKVKFNMVTEENKVILEFDDSKKKLKTLFNKMKSLQVRMMLKMAGIKVHTEIEREED